MTLYREVHLVFGSNEAGRHGKGAALFAREVYGAKYGVGIGPTGRAYAIPTKDEKLNPLPMEKIIGSIVEFINHAEDNPETLFIFSPVGCGLAGKNPKDMIKILTELRLPTNVVLDSSWVNDKKLV